MVALGAPDAGTSVALEFVVALAGFVVWREAELEEVRASPELSSIVESNFFANGWR